MDINQVNVNGNEGDNSKVTPAEEKLHKHMYGMLGSFFTALFDAIFKADGTNTERLRLGYPEEVAVVERYKHEDGYWQELQLRMDRYYKSLNRRDGNSNV